MIMLNLKNSSVENFLSTIENKRILVYGAGRVLRSALETLGVAFYNRIAFLIDRKSGGVFESGDYSLPIQNLSDVLSAAPEEYALLITPLVYDEIFNELNTMDKFHGMDCYIYPIMRDTASPHSFPQPLQGAKLRIPKRINYIWFGGGKMSDLNKRCIESWHKYCPDYEIVLFNEDNYDVTKQPFMYEAYKAKKWASAAEVARLDILKSYGGIYIDTDIELVKNIDFLLYNDFFGYLQSNWFAVNFFGCVQGCSLIDKLMTPYLERDYLKIKSSTEYSEQIIVDSFKLNKMAEYGFRKWQDGERLDGGANLFPQDTIILNTRTSSITPNTVGIHYYQRTWCEELIPKEERFGRFYAEHAHELKVEGCLQ